MAKENTGAALGIGAGVAAAAAAAAGAYWLYGAKHSAKHRKMAKSWMLKARAEVLEAVEKLEDIDKDKYLAIAERVLKGHANRGVTKAEIDSMMKDFKTAWSHMQGKKKGGKRTAKSGRRKAKKAPSKRGK
jgi:NAD(P)-dependent dehydrogenase (short-subunit alcohol dehydrogenase family)